MVIKRLVLENFRNIESCDISFSEGVNLLFGENAQGKTNAVEGIYLFARGRSFRSADEGELLRFGAEGFRVYIEYLDKMGKGTLEYARFGRDRRRRKNWYPVKSVKEMLGSFRAVLFCPEDLSLVKNSPEERRAFMNVALSQCYPPYVEYYAAYKNALENRNCLLKAAAKGQYYDQKELESWSVSLAEYSSYLYIYRRDYVKNLEVFAKEVMRDISDGREELSLTYKSNISSDSDDREAIRRQYEEIYISGLEKEKLAGTSLYGIHRDDLEILINGKSARSFASQGQQRSITLALKLAEGECNREVYGEYPVFLFDDVLSELDDKRRSYLLSGIGERQIIITSCERSEISLMADNIIEVRDGKYTNV